MTYMMSIEQKQRIKDYSENLNSYLSIFVDNMLKNQKYLIILYLH